MDKLEEEWTSLMSIYSRRAGKAFCHMESCFRVFFDPPKAGDKVFTQLEDIAKMARMYNGGIQFEEDRSLLQELSEGSREPELQKKVAQKILDMSLTKILQRHLKGLKEAQSLNRKIPKRLDLWKDDNVQAGPSRKDFIQSLKTKLRNFSNFVGHHSLVLSCLDLKLKEQSRLNKKTKTLLSKMVKANRKLLQSFPAKRSSDESEMEGGSGVNKGQTRNVRLIQVQPNNQMEDTTDSEESFSGESEGDTKDTGVRVIQVKPRNPDTPFYTPPTAFRTPKLSICPTVSTKGQEDNEVGQLAPKGPREASGHTPSRPPSPPGASNSGQRVEEPMPHRVPRPPKGPSPYRAPNSPSANQNSVSNTAPSARQRRIAAKATGYCTSKDSAPNKTPSAKQHPVPTQATSTSQDSVFTKDPSTTQRRILKQTTVTPHDSVHNKATSATQCQIPTQATSPAQDSRLNKAFIQREDVVPTEAPSLPQDPLPHRGAIGPQDATPCHSTSQADIIPENAPVQAFGKLDPVSPPKMPKAAWESPKENTLSKLSNVYVRVTTPYKSLNKTEISLKVGQKLKQKTPADDKGFAFGWTRANRLAPKRWGFYPVSCVKLVPDKTN